MSLFSGTASSMQYRSDKSDKSNKKKCTGQENANKENVEQQNKMFSLNNLNKVNFRERKLSDDGYDKLQRPRKLQAIDVGNRVPTVNDPRAFRKSRFSIYKDATDHEENDRRDKEFNFTKKKVPVALHEILTTNAAYNIDYMYDFLRYQMEMDEKRRLPDSLLEIGITMDQRRLIVKYLIRSVACKKYPSFITYQAVKIFDFYVASVVVSVDELQTTALAALWIALKKDMITDEIPDATRLLDQLAGTVYKGNIKPLVKCEKKMLMALKFEVSFADPFSIFALLIVTITRTRQMESEELQKLYYCGSYMIDISSLVHDKMINVSTICLAIMSAEIALTLYYTSNEEINNPKWTYWRELIFMNNPSIHCLRFSDQLATQIRSELLKKAILSKDDQTDYHIVYKKYSSKRYGSISKCLTAKISSLYLRKVCDPNYCAQPIVFS